MRRNYKAGFLRGFTIVELQVSVSVIALMVSILMPAIGSARRQAQRVACMSNAHQLGLVMYYYLHDNDHTFPGNKGAIGLTSTKDLWGRAGTIYPTTADQRPLNKYLGLFGPDDDVLICRDPADIGMQPTYYSDLATDQNYLAYGSSYSYNANINGNFVPHRINTLSGLDISKVKTPYFTVMLGCDPMHGRAQFDKIVGCTADNLGMRWHHPNKDTANICYVDGHVAYVEVETGLNITTTKYFTFLPKPLGQ